MIENLRIQDFDSLLSRILTHRCQGFWLQLSRILSPAVQDFDSPCCSGYEIPTDPDFDSRFLTPCCTGFWLLAVQDFDSTLSSVHAVAVWIFSCRIIGKLDVKKLDTVTCLHIWLGISMCVVYECVTTAKCLIPLCCCVQQYFAFWYTVSLVQRILGQ